MTLPDDEYLDYGEMFAFLDAIANSNRPQRLREGAAWARDQVTDLCEPLPGAPDRLVVFVGGRPKRFESHGEKVAWLRTRARWRSGDVGRRRERPDDVALALDIGAVAVNAAAEPAPRTGRWPCLTDAITQSTEGTSDAEASTYAGRYRPSVKDLMLRFVERLASGEQTTVYESRGGQQLGRRDDTPPLALLPAYRELLGETSPADDPAADPIDEAARKRADDRHRTTLARRYQPRARVIWSRATAMCR